MYVPIVSGNYSINFSMLCINEVKAVILNLLALIRSTPNLFIDLAAAFMVWFGGFFGNVVNGVKFFQDILFVITC